MVLIAAARSSRPNYGQIADKLEVGNLIQTQLDSFEWFKKEGLRELFDEINPITDYTGKNYELRFLDYEFGDPKFDEEECRQRDMTFSVPLRINTRLYIKTGENAGEIKEAEVFMGDFPTMTREGTFIVNGTERVVVSQLVRSPGVYFTASDDRVTGRRLYAAKLIPNRGAWLEIETSSKDVLTVKIDRKRKVPVTTLVRALGYASNEDIRAFFTEVDNDPEHQYIAATLDKDPSTSVEEALTELYQKIRPRDPPTVENARNLLTALFFNPRRFDLSKVGRFKLDKNLGIPEDEARERAWDKDRRVLDNHDFISIIRKLIQLNDGIGEPDDIDHRGNRRVRAVGELLQNQFRMGLVRMERIIKERMTITDAATVTAASLINARPVVAAIKEFFGSSQLSQFMDQTNPLAELTHKRRLSALGPGGLSRERAGFDVRDVHHSHYGRICPIETPEGPNIGLIGSLASYAKVNEFGFVETPFRRVYNRISVTKANKSRLLGRVLRRPGADDKGKEFLKAGETLDAANRALMGANMQKQAVPLLTPDSPLVGTGVEYYAAKDSGEMLVAEVPGTVVDVARPQDGRAGGNANPLFEVVLKPDDGSAERHYALQKFYRSNQGTCLNHRVVVQPGQHVDAGEILADGPAISNGEMALGQNVLVAFMPWEGYNFEDAILISESVVKEDKYTSIHIEEFEIEARETKLGPEEITRDIPNVSDDALRNLNERVRVYVAQKRKIAAGDKMAGRHGNKGVIAPILPIEDMPYMPDGTPTEIVLNPLGVPSRMNLGQVLETHLGWVAKTLGFKLQTPVFDGAPISAIRDELKQAGLPIDGKVRLRDGRSGDEFDEPVTVGWIYMLKLAHLVEDKIHARSTGPYSLVTQQPLGGKAQFGGQRFGEMEVWALEAYGAAHVLQEILTVKSDDIVGRVKAYEAIVKGDNTLEAGIPESFRVLVKELEGLALGVEILSEDERQIVLSEEDIPEIPLDLGISLEREELGEDSAE